MYLEHFGLRETPFNITPDTAFFFASARYQGALNTLLIAARTGEGFMKITGEVGTGKTLLCRKFIASLDETFKVAYIPNPYLEPHSLLLALAEELDIEVADSGQHHLLKAITQALMEFCRQGRQVIVCLDEAQAMPLETMEALRLLTNLETEKRKLLQVVIFGQPELEDKLNQQSVRQLKQRITFDYRLSPLTRDDLHYYLNHRLIVAGYQGGRLFSSWALWMLHRRTEGIPRLVNIVAHKAMLAGFGKGKHTVGVAEVMAAANDTASARKLNWRLAALSAVLVALLVAAWMWNSMP